VHYAGTEIQAHEHQGATRTSSMGIRRPTSTPVEWSPPRDTATQPGASHVMINDFGFSSDSGSRVAGTESGRRTRKVMVSRLTREADHVSLLLGGVFEGVNCLIYRE
jgi:hypothetical protein